MECEIDKGMSNIKKIHALDMCCYIPNFKIVAVLVAE